MGHWLACSITLFWALSFQWLWLCYSYRIWMQWTVFTSSFKESPQQEKGLPSVMPACLYVWLLDCPTVLFLFTLGACGTNVNLHICIVYICVSLTYFDATRHVLLKQTLSTNDDLLCCCLFLNSTETPVSFIHHSNTAWLHQSARRIPLFFYI